MGGGMKRGSRWRAVDRILPGDRGRGPCLSVYSPLRAGAKGARRPTVALWLPFSRIDLTLGPDTPREPGTWRHGASFVEGDSPVQSDSRQR